MGMGATDETLIEYGYAGVAGLVIVPVWTTENTEDTKRTRGSGLEQKLTKGTKAGLELVNGEWGLPVAVNGER